ncbi:MAG: LL-diaminopimelate aminotransferase [Actinomycetes bacterium]
MNATKRLDLIPPYLFAELERKIAEKRAEGVDVISLGIGDPDMPTFPAVVAAGQAALADPSTHQYPSNRGRPEFRNALSAFYKRRFGVDIDPETEVIPAIGAKECIFNLSLAFLDPSDVALASDPGYPVYTAGPVLAGAEAWKMPLVPSRGFTPDLAAIPGEILERVKLMFINYPNNPTGAIVPDGFFDEVVEFATRNQILVVHDNAYSETTYDGYVAPSFLATPGAKEVGVEVFSLSKGYNMTGWRCAAILGNADAIASYWKLKSNIDSGLFDAVQLAGAVALGSDIDPEVDKMCEIYQRRRDLVCAALAEAGVDVSVPKGTIYVWAPIPDGFEDAASYCEFVLEKTGVVISPGGAYGPSGEGFFRISLTTPDDRLSEAVARLSALRS